MENLRILTIIKKMKSELSKEQLDKLIEVLYETENNVIIDDNIDYISHFLAVKKIEGCSTRTDEYYKQVLKYFENNINKKLCLVTTEDIRVYLSDYQNQNKCSNTTLDNIRRILSSFYGWLEEENYIVKSPMKRIHKVKSPVIVKSIYTDEQIELLRNKLTPNIRNFAILNLLISSGLRIGELVRLDINNVNFSSMTAIVRGKGNKERIIYFDVKTKLSLQKYLSNRCDTNPALFVSLRSYSIKNGRTRITINNIERIIRQAGNELNISRAYPHKFRRTIATKAIDKGMPIEQVQILLGHSKIDTTLHYAQVQQRNVGISYQKYIS